MPPFTAELGLILAIGTGLIRVTTSINRIEQQQRIGHSELMGEVMVLKEKISFLERESIELKVELKESRRKRFNDPN